MKTSTNLTIYNLGENVAYCEAIGLSKVFEAYANIGEDIMEGGIGFNSNSGYIYIALENGISICSMLGREAEFLVTNFEDGEESFFDKYEDAEKFAENLNA
jgi:hypothetical protein